MIIIRLHLLYSALATNQGPTKSGRVPFFSSKMMDHVEGMGLRGVVDRVKDACSCAIASWHFAKMEACLDTSPSRPITLSFPSTNPYKAYGIPVSLQNFLTSACALLKLCLGRRGKRWCTTWNWRPPCIQSSQGGQSTSIVVRNIFCGKDSEGPRSAVLMAKCETVNCTWRGMFIMCETKMKERRDGQVGMERKSISYPNQYQKIISPMTSK